MYLAVTLALAILIWSEIATRPGGVDFSPTSGRVVTTRSELNPAGLLMGFFFLITGIAGCGALLAFASMTDDLKAMRNIAEWKGGNS
jgi:hypothetical protein